jgi:hypothetical protein
MLDKLGNQISIGDRVVYPRYNSLEVGQVVNITKKMVAVRILKMPYGSWVDRKYSQDLLKIAA